MSISDLFVCPKDKMKVKKNIEYYECVTCKTKYPIVNEVPVFITGETETNKFSEFWNEGWNNRVENGDHQQIKKDELKDLEEKLSAQLDKLKATKHTFADTIPVNGKKILNIGCGMEPVMFAYAGADEYIGIDYSYNAAKNSFEGIKKLGGKGITAQANAELLPIENDSIDLIYSNGVLHHTPKTQITIDEVYRVMKPGGKAIIGLYSTYSPHFILAKIIGKFKAIVGRSKKKWYEYSETAWQTSEKGNPYTKTYSKKELVRLFSPYKISEINFRKTSFSWANAVPKLGKYLDKTKIGKKLGQKLQSILGGMWVIKFSKA